VHSIDKTKKERSDFDIFSFASFKSLKNINYDKKSRNGISKVRTQ